MRIPEPILRPQAQSTRRPAGNTGRGHRQRWRWALLLALLAGALLLPVAAYVAGGAVIGPYEGKRGLASYLDTLYRDAGHGRLPALLVLFGPAAGVLVWRLRRILLDRGTDPGTPQ